MLDKLGWCAACAMACVVGAAQVPERGGDESRPVEPVVNVQDARPLETVAPPPEDLNTDGPSVEPGAVAVPTPAAPVSQFVHRIQANLYGGSCVYLGDGVYITAKHVIHGLPGGWTLKIDGKQYGADRPDHTSHDASFLFVHKPPDTPGVEIVEDLPEVGSKVYVYGMETGEVQEATIERDGSNSGDPVALAFCDGPGVTQGDSGGGVFDAEGRLVGIISAFMGSERSGTADKRRCFFVPMAHLSSHLSVAGADTVVCQCGGSNEGVCHCVQHGVQCNCTANKGSVWATDSNGRATHKTGEYANPNQSANTTPRMTTPAPTFQPFGWNQQQYCPNGQCQRYRSYSYGDD